jgi:hypothetical protein
VFSLSLEKGDVVLHLQTESQIAHEFVKELFHEPQLVVDHPAVANASDDILIRFGCQDVQNIEQADGTWWIEDNNDTTWIDKKDLKTGDFVFHLSDRMVFHCADKIRSSHCLHAAAVAKDDLAIVIPAKSGSGKSSLTCWLLANGFDYITDELIMVGESGQFESLRRPLQIKFHGLDAVKPLLRVEQEKLESAFYSGKWANAIPASSFGANLSAYTEHKLSMFLFPKYDAAKECDFDRLKQAQAGLVLMGNNVNARNHPSHGFKELMALVRKVPSYYLNYGGFDKLPSDFAQQLERIIKGA